MKNIFAALAGACLAFSVSTAIAADLTDPEIAHIAVTAGTIDVDAGNLALSKTTNDDVKAFAQQMVDDHTAVNDKAADLVKELGVTPEDNATSQALVEAADAEKAKLEALDGAEFDKAYVDNEVAYHEQVIGALNDQLIPATQNDQLKDFLQSGVTLFEGHLEHAKKIADELK